MQNNKKIIIKFKIMNFMIKKNNKKINSILKIYNQKTIKMLKLVMYKNDTTVFIKSKIF